VEHYGVQHLLIKFVKLAHLPLQEQMLTATHGQHVLLQEPQEMFVEHAIQDIISMLLQVFVQHVQQSLTVKPDILVVLLPLIKHVRVVLLENMEVQLVQHAQQLPIVLLVL
jgi:hypothetical protein